MTDKQQTEQILYIRIMIDGQTEWLKN